MLSLFLDLRFKFTNVEKERSHKYVVVKTMTNFTAPLERLWYLKGFEYYIILYLIHSFLSFSRKNNNDKDCNTGFCQEVLPENELRLYFGPNNMFWNKKITTLRCKWIKFMTKQTFCQENYKNVYIWTSNWLKSYNTEILKWNLKKVWIG